MLTTLQLAGKGDPWTHPTICPGVHCAAQRVHAVCPGESAATASRWRSGNVISPAWWTAQTAWKAYISSTVDHHFPLCLPQDINERASLKHNSGPFLSLKKPCHLHVYKVMTLALMLCLQTSHALAERCELPQHGDSSMFLSLLMGSIHTA